MERIFRHRLTVFVLAVALALGVAGCSLVLAENSVSSVNPGRWVAGDFHTHTYLTDGSRTLAEVVNNAYKYGLDWVANSEHGGKFQRYPDGRPILNPVTKQPAYLWRWVTLKNYSFPLIQSLRKANPGKLLVQGVEWNVPGHEHASVGMVAYEQTAVSNFEYMFDAVDHDTSRAAQGVQKHNTTHAGAVAGAKWLEQNFSCTSYFILNHPSRGLKYSIANIRDFNNAAPDVCFGFEGVPGYQKNSSRGGYHGNFAANTYKARTYGGVDYMLARVGGVWDALLGEGRRFWVFANSDFHSPTVSFWPGEYAKSYTWVNGNGYTDLVNGMRAGNTFAVEGDLINGLEFSAGSKNKSAVMGGELIVRKGDNAQFTIRFKSPPANNNGDKVTVNHIDLIGGDVTGKVSPTSPNYKKDTNNTTGIVRRFTAKDWTKDKDGWYVITFNLGQVQKSRYFRLRGTNLGLGAAKETDVNGNPLRDDLAGPNNASKAYKDIWFYSNPVFITAK